MLRTFSVIITERLLVFETNFMTKVSCVRLQTKITLCIIHFSCVSTVKFSHNNAKTGLEPLL